MWLLRALTNNFERTARLALIVVLLVVVFSAITGCALTASASANRTIQNSLAVDQAPAFAIRALDPKTEYAVEFRSLAQSLSRELTAVGMKASDKPDTLFMVGYAMEFAENGDWDRTLVIYGYDVKTAKRVYEATIKTTGRIASAYEIGDVFFQSIAKDIRKRGETKDTVTYRHIPRS